MTRISEDDKRKRKERVYRTLQRHPDGLSSIELADATQLERRTIDNYLGELDSEGHVYKEGKLWFAFPKKPLELRKFNFDPEEAVLLYLAARLFVKQTDRRVEAAETALLQLAESLSADARLGDILVQAANELAKRPQVPGYTDIFRTVIQGYLYHCHVQIRYAPYRGEAFTTTIAPYLLEPSAIGMSTYVICHSSIVNTLRTYKISRITDARLLHRQPFTTPGDFPGLELLRNAWSIYYGEETLRVILRFHPDVAKRVMETQWHPSQQLAADDQQAGYLQMAVDVADFTDLKPWIRTWGANCEVLAPNQLRNEMIGEARRLAMLYGWHTTRNQQFDDDDPLGLNNTLNDFFS